MRSTRIVKASSYRQRRIIWPQANSNSWEAKVENILSGVVIKRIICRRSLHTVQTGLTLICREIIIRLTIILNHRLRRCYQAHCPVSSWTRVTPTAMMLMPVVQFRHRELSFPRLVRRDRCRSWVTRLFSSAT